LILLLKRKGVSGRSGRMEVTRKNITKQKEALSIAGIWYMRLEIVLRKQNLETLGSPNKETRSSKMLGE